MISSAADGVSENVKKWTPNQMKVQEWLATPKFERTPPTQDMLADSINIASATISRWKKIDGFMDEVVAISRRMLHSNLPDIYGALSREAIKGSYQHIKLALELNGEYIDKLDVTSGGQPIKGYIVFSPDQWDDEDESGDKED